MTHSVNSDDSNDNGITVTPVQPIMPEVEAVQPNMPEVEAVQPTLPEVEAVQPIMPEVEAVQPTLPEVEAVQPTLPEVEAVQPTLPEVEAVQPTLPEVEAVQPIMPEVEAVQPTLPEVEAVQPVPLGPVQPITPEAGSDLEVEAVQPLPLGPVYASEEAVEDDVMAYIASDSIDVQASSAFTLDPDLMSNVGAVGVTPDYEATSDYLDALSGEANAAQTELTRFEEANQAANNHLNEIATELGPQSDYSDLLSA